MKLLVESKDNLNQIYLRSIEKSWLYLNWH